MPQEKSLKAAVHPPLKPSSPRETAYLKAVLLATECMGASFFIPFFTLRLLKQVKDKILRPFRARDNVGTIFTLILRIEENYTFIVFVPLIIFLGLYLGSGIVFSIQGAEDAFYKISPSVCIVPALVMGVLLGKKPFSKGIHSLIEGMRHPDIIMMCLIFLLAGAFTHVTKALGSVDATVSAAMSFIHADYLLGGIFVISAFISTSIGTSMGVIALMGPIAVGLAQQGAFAFPLGMATVIGGAMFGDNLSLISDTTIAAVQSVGADYRKKFRLNGKVALLAGIITLALLTSTHQGSPLPSLKAGSWWLIAPYGVILLSGLMGVNVFAVLLLGLLTSLGLGLVTDVFSLTSFSALMAKGFESMADIMILSLCVGGLSGLLRAQGGIQKLNDKISFYAAKKKGSQGAELLMAALSSLFDMLIANNTIAIILLGDITRSLALTFKVPLHRAAYIIDTFSCIFQGLLPYGAQMLLASKLAGINPLEMVAHVYYCYVLGAIALGEIWLHHRKR